MHMESVPAGRWQMAPCCWPYAGVGRPHSIRIGTVDAFPPPVATVRVQLPEFSRARHRGTMSGRRCAAAGILVGIVLNIALASLSVSAGVGGWSRAVLAGRSLSRARAILGRLWRYVRGLAKRVGKTVTGPRWQGAHAAEKKTYVSPDCDSCRTVVEQFYKGWYTACGHTNAVLKRAASSGVFGPYLPALSAFSRSPCDSSLRVQGEGSARISCGWHL